jgi:DNA-directed RNA polymerase specialized sigma24 family protein
MTPAANRIASEADLALLQALRQGDEQAFALARLYVSSFSIADEVVQDTWIGVIEGVWAFEGRSSLRTWILRILINRAKTRGLREKRTVPFAASGTGDLQEAEIADDDAYPRAAGRSQPFQPPAPRHSGLRDSDPSTALQGYLEPFRREFGKASNPIVVGVPGAARRSRRCEPSSSRWGAQEAGMRRRPAPRRSGY